MGVIRPVLSTIITIMIVGFFILCFLIYFAILISARGRFRTIHFLLIAYFSAVGIVFYMLLYPQLPQAFGGVQPRCAYVDVTIGKVSTETLDGIVARKAPDKKEIHVVRTKKLDVFFSGRDFMLIRPQSGKGHAKPIYELKKDVIKAITWCD